MIRQIENSVLIGEVEPPISKSMADRMMLCEYLAGESVSLQSDSNDLLVLYNALEALGSDREIFCGESGSALRFLLPICAALDYEHDFVMSERLSKRPHTELLNTLCDHGCKITEKDGKISLSGRIKGGDYMINCAESSQFATGLLFALPICTSGSRLRLINVVSRPYINMTIKILRSCGINISGEADLYTIEGGQSYHKPSYEIECDWSAAAFWLCAGVIGGDIGVKGMTLPSIQGDAVIYEKIREIGGCVNYDNGEVHASKSHIIPFEFDLIDTPDLAPCLAALACKADGVTRISGISRLRGKESDRAEAIKIVIQSLGGSCKIDRDTLVIEGGKALDGGECDSYRDHRIAMMSAILSLICRNNVILHGSEAIKKSYPTFFEDFATLGGRC